MGNRVCKPKEKASFPRYERYIPEQHAGDIIANLGTQLNPNDFRAAATELIHAQGLVAICNDRVVAVQFLYTRQDTGQDKAVVELLDHYCFVARSGDRELLSSDLMCELLSSPAWYGKVSTFRVRQTDRLVRNIDFIGLLQKFEFTQSSNAQTGHAWWLAANVVSELVNRLRW